LVLAFFVRSDLLESELAERCDEPAFADPSAERIKALERFDAIVAGTSIDECVERSYGIHRHPPSERESGAPIGRALGSRQPNDLSKRFSASERDCALMPENRRHRSNNVRLEKTVSG